MEKDSKIILTVFFEGTSNPIGYRVTQIGLFGEKTHGRNITDTENFGDLDPDKVHHFKMLFDGCGKQKKNFLFLTTEFVSFRCKKIKSFAELPKIK